MKDLFWLTQTQLDRIAPHFPLSHGIPRVDDLRVISGIIHVIKRGLQWRDAPSDYGPHKTLYNRFVRWSRMGVFDRIFADLAAGEGVPEQLQIDATHLKALYDRGPGRTYRKSARKSASTGSTASRKPVKRSRGNCARVPDP